MYKLERESTTLVQKLKKGSPRAHDFSILIAALEVLWPVQANGIVSQSTLTSLIEFIT
jgi:hypothetical protein